MTVCEAHILPMTKSMPIKTSVKVKASRKSHTVLSCETPDFVGTFRLIPSNSRLTLKKVKK